MKTKVALIVFFKLFTTNLLAAPDCGQFDLKIEVGYFKNSQEKSRSYQPLPKTFNDHVGAFDSFWIKTNKKSGEYKLKSGNFIMKGKLEHDDYGLTPSGSNRDKTDWLSREFSRLLDNRHKEVTLEITIDNMNCEEKIRLK